METRDTRVAKLDLNRASEEELKSIEGIDAALAGRILAFREKHGGFTSWEAFEQVEGIGPARAEKVRAVATLGAEQEEAGAMVELGPLQVLTVTARLDLEAALAYDAGASAVTEAELREQLLRFRDDHLRHLEALNRLLVAQGGSPIDAQADGSALLLPSVALIAGALGTEAVLMTLLTNEQMTNGVYDMTLQVEWDEEMTALMEQHAADEARHLSWLGDQVDALFPDDVGASRDDAQA
jgi:competence ComEA-like helix-hairpin-helix protein